MRALLKALCVVGMVAAITASASARDVRSNRTTDGGGPRATPNAGIAYDAGGAPYSPHQRAYDTSNDFQLQHGLKDPARPRNPNDEKKKDDAK